MSVGGRLDLKRFQAERLLQFDTGPFHRGRVCTLLIPFDLRAKLQFHLLTTKKSLGSYLGELLKKNRVRMLKDNWQARCACFRQYQAPGLQLCRQNFRAAPVVWYELGVFANFLGVSRCFLFVRLIELDLDGYPDNLEGVPTVGLEEYDQFFPQHIETRVRIIRGRSVQREISQIPKDTLDLPLRFFPFPYPEELLRAWLRRKFAIESG